jgi:hypothetical protein
LTEGSLVRTDLQYESFFATLPNGFRHRCSVVAAPFRGKADLKAYLAETAVLDYALSSYNPAVVDTGSRNYRLAICQSSCIGASTNN